MSRTSPYRLARRHGSGRADGFTLVELLVVISVILMLTAILLPVVQQAKEQAVAVVCRSNLRQWGLVLRTYTAETEGQLHNQGHCHVGAPEFWMHYLSRSLDEPAKVRCCPVASRPAAPEGAPAHSPRVGGGTRRAWGRFRPYLSEHTRSDALYHGSYGMNSWVAVPNDDGHLVIGGGRPEQFWTHTQVKSAERIPVFLDSWWWCAWVKHQDTPPKTENERTAFICGCRNSIHRFCVDRHNGSINATFLDNSVRRVGLKELWTLKWHRQYETVNPWTYSRARPTDWPMWMRDFKDH